MSSEQTSRPAAAVAGAMREMVPADIPAIERLLGESPDAAQWSRTVLMRDTAEGIPVWVVEESGEVVGMVAARAAGGEAEILNLAVLPQYRSRGLGHRLLEHAVARMREAGAASVFLEVREGNSSARAFYGTMGFVAAGRRRAYYRDPVEDAIVLSLSVKPG